MIITLLFAAVLAFGSQPKIPSAQHEQMETLIYQRIEFYHELIPFRASRRLKSDYWKAVGCFYKFQEYKVSDCGKPLSRVEQDLKRPEK